MICISLKLLTKTSRNEFQLHEFVEYSAFILRRFPVNVVLSPCPRRREQFNYCCRVTVLRFFLLLSLLLLCLEFKLIETVCFSQGSMRPIITELDNNKKGSIRTDVADLVLVKYVFRAHAFHRAHDFTPETAEPRTRMHRSHAPPPSHRIFFVKTTACAPNSRAISDARPTVQNRRYFCAVQHEIF